MWTPPPEHKNLYLIGGGGLLLVILAFVIFRPSSGPKLSPDDALIAKLTNEGNVEEIEKEAAATKKPAVKQILYRALGKQGSRARPVVERGLSSPDASIRVGAISAMPMVAPATEYSAVKNGLNDPSPEVRRAAAAALADMKAWGSLPDLLKVMADDQDTTVRQAAVNAFEKIAYIQATGYKADDLPGQRASALRNLKIFASEPGRKEVYEKWLKEIGVIKAE